MKNKQAEMEELKKMKKIEFVLIDEQQQQE